MIDVSRRFFCFGAAAALIVPPPKSFFIVKPPKLIIPTPDRPFDLPTQQMLQLMERLEKQLIEMSGIPRWVVGNQDWYDQVVAEEKSRPPGRRDTLTVARPTSGDQPGDGSRRVALRS
jgi:hypothetical protein